MVNEDSPIKRFYPEDFQTDLNGKEHDWEAVVLIPFIDEDQLMEAMQGHASSLLKEVGVCEYNRNCCRFNVGEFPNKILTLPIRYWSGHQLESFFLKNYVLVDKAPEQLAINGNIQYTQ